MVTDNGKATSESRIDRQKIKQSTLISEDDGNSVDDINAVNNFRNKNLVRSGWKGSRGYQWEGDIS